MGEEQRPRRIRAQASADRRVIFGFACAELLCAKDHGALLSASPLAAEATALYTVERDTEMRVLAGWGKLRVVREVLLAAALFFPIVGHAQTEDATQTTIRVNSALVLVDVITQDAKALLPLVGLKKDDFRIFDNGTEMPIQSFDVGARYGTRPISLWFVVICNEMGWDENGSGFMRRKGSLLRPAIDHLDKNDTLGIAHWCDDQKFKIDYAPSRDFDSALAALEKLFHGWPKSVGTRTGELALQGMLRLILENVHHTKPEPLPVIVFLYGDHSGMEREEVDDLLNDLLQTSGIVYGINDGAVPVSPVYLDNQHAQPNVAHFLAVKTGGQFFSVEPKMYATSLDDILVQVHFRYVLGFRPLAFDGKTHKLRVELTNAATQKFPPARLSFRPAYIPPIDR